MKKKKYKVHLDVSVQFNKELDKVGFDKRTSKKRISFMTKLSTAKNIANKQTLGIDDCQIDKIFVGSQCDGTGFNHFNDLDILQIDNTVLCKYEEQCIKLGDNRVIFEANHRSSPHGYVYLKPLKNKSETYEQFKYAFVERNNESYLSSKQYLAGKVHQSEINSRCDEKITQQLSCAGPSIPKCIKQNSSAALILSCLNLKAMDTDIVNALPCSADPIIEEWSKRERKSGWPRKETISHVVNLPAHVVPVGQRGSSNEDLQWRICFTFGELYLVQNFNDIQRKIFVLLKLIAKHILKPICNDISSYIMKNVMFWISEEIPEQMFNEDNFQAILLDALTFLLQAIRKKKLQNYMIPSRNLFKGKFDENGLISQKLNDAISKCINEPDLLFNEMQPILSSMKMGNKTETIEREILDPLPTDKLVEMYVQMNSCQSAEDMIHLNIFYKAIPFWNMFGKKLFTKNVRTSVEKQIGDLTEHYLQSDLKSWLNICSSLTMNFIEEVMVYDEPWQQESLFDLSCICVFTTLLYVI